MNTATAEKITFIDPAQHRIWGVNLPDLADKANWLMAKLKPRFPGQQEAHILNWLRSLAGANGAGNYHFVRTQGGVALSEYRREKLSHEPKVIDHFVFLEEGVDVSEGEALYDDMRRWAASVGASEIIIDPKSDVPREFIEGRLGRLTKREILVAKTAK